MYVNLHLSVAPNCDVNAVRHKTEQTPTPTPTPSQAPTTRHCTKWCNLFKPTSTMTTTCRSTAFSSTKKLPTMYLWVSYVYSKNRRILPKQSKQTRFCNRHPVSFNTSTVYETLLTSHIHAEIHSYKYTQYEFETLLFFDVNLMKNTLNLRDSR